MKRKSKLIPSGRRLRPIRLNLKPSSTQAVIRDAELHTSRCEPRALACTNAIKSRMGRVTLVNAAALTDDGHSALSFIPCEHDSHVDIVLPGRSQRGAELRNCRNVTMKSGDAATCRLRQRDVAEADLMLRRTGSCWGTLRERSSLKLRIA